MKIYVRMSVLLKMKRETSTFEGVKSSCNSLELRRENQAHGVYLRP